jgi:hypothetical protein
MTGPIPMAFTWDGDAMVPAHPRLADRHFVIGEVYSLVQHEDRSAVSHRHYFASIREAHNNLPEDVALDFPTPERLRKFCLIKAGYCDSQSFVASSKAEALRLAAFIKPVDEFSVVTVEGPVVTRYTAKSQSERAMGKKEFQASKDAVLGIISDMLGVAPRDLETARAA